MAVKSSQLNITDLDFEDISLNLRNYLKGQDQFKDYDFDGSSMSILVDLLAYASHIGAVNTNIAASELFLDSAQIRKNVVSRAKDLGFVPQSETGATAIVDITLSSVKNPDDTYPTTVEMSLNRGSLFQSTFDGTTYDFIVPSTIKPTQSGDTYIYNNVQLVQGI